jgi:hypothetical protein
MRRSISPWWHPRQRMSRHTQEPGFGFFQGLRMRLTLWYCGMLGLALVLFGVVLYYGTSVKKKVLGKRGKSPCYFALDDSLASFTPTCSERHLPAQQMEYPQLPPTHAT